MASPALLRRRSLLAVLAVLVVAAGVATWLLVGPTAPPPAAPAAAILELAAADLAVARDEPVAATLALAGLLQPLAESGLTAEV